MSLSDEASLPAPRSSPPSMWLQVTCTVFTPALLNDFRFGFNRYVLDYVPINFVPNGGLGNELGVPNSNVTPREQNLPIFSPSDYLGVGQTRSLPLYRRENTFQELDNLTWTKGTHTFKIGADFRRRQLTIYQTNQGNGRFNFSPAFTDSRKPAGKGGDASPSFILGFPTLDAHDYTFQFPGIRLNEFGMYFADDWRVTKNLTLNYGLRWDYFSPPDEAFNRWSNFDVVTGQYLVAGVDGVNQNAGVLKYWPKFWPTLRICLPGATSYSNTRRSRPLLQCVGQRGGQHASCAQSAFRPDLANYARRHYGRSNGQRRLSSLCSQSSFLLFRMEPPPQWPQTSVRLTPSSSTLAWNRRLSHSTWY